MIYVDSYRFCVEWIETSSLFFNVLILVLRVLRRIYTKFLFVLQLPFEPLKGYGSLAHGYDWYQTLTVTVQANIDNADFRRFILLLQWSSNDLA